MKKVKKTYFKNRRLILGNGRTQKGGLFHIAALLHLLLILLEKESEKERKKLKTCRP